MRCSFSRRLRLVLCLSVAGTLAVTGQSAAVTGRATERQGTPPAVQRSAAHVGIAAAPALTAKQAGDALAAATTTEQARAALLAIFPAGGIALDDGTGAPAATADVTVPAWLLDALAQSHIAGTSITVADNARIFDGMSRWAGGPTVSAARFSTFLSTWLAHPGDAQQGYVLEAIAETGRRTEPAYDLAKGAGPDAPMPLLILLEEMISLHAITAPAGGPPGLRRPTDRPTGNPFGPIDTNGCALIGKAKDANDLRQSAESIYDGMTSIGESSESFWDGVSETIGEIGEHYLGGLDEPAAAGEAAEGAAATAAAVAMGIASGILQDALAQAHLKVEFQQDPRPVAANERSSPPNPVTATFTFTAGADMPQEEADCLKLLGDKFPDMSLPKPTDPIKGADVEVDTGANFMDLLYWDSDDYLAHDNGHYTTDDAGQIRVKMITRSQKLPKGQGQDHNESAMVHVTAHLNDVPTSWWDVLSVSGYAAAILDHVVPWDQSYPIAVTRRETRAITIKGSFNVDLFIIGVKGTLNLHSCDGFDGFLNGTLHLSGGYENGADQVVTAITGLPSNGSGDVPVSVHVPEQDRATPTDPGMPKLGVVTPLVKKLGIKFIDENTAELVADGHAMFDPQTGAAFTFPVTPGSDASCPGQ